jgi:4'-phosphopantetheinyl transferase
VVRSARVPRLAAGEVHAWRFSLGDDGPAIDARSFPADDIARSQRFVFERDRRRFLRSRHVLRELLDGYAGGEPAGHALSFGAHGKPAVDARFGLDFNLSHSGDRGLIAFARDAQVGVDIEEISERPGMRALAASVMSPEEQAALRDIPDETLAVPFLTCWTRKEACLKAVGVGLSLEPRSVTVGIRAVRSRIRLGAAWREEIEVANLFEDGHSIAALAVAGGYTRVRLLDWTA